MKLGSLHLYWADSPVDGSWPYVFITVERWTKPRNRLEHWLYPHWQYVGLKPGTVWFVEWRRLWVWWVSLGAAR